MNKQAFKSVYGKYADAKACYSADAELLESSSPHLHQFSAFAKGLGMDDILEFAKKVSELKRLKRAGWVIKGVKSPESVADHSFMLAIIAYVYAKKLGLKRDKCAKMALLHDICETYSGDIPNRMKPKDRTMTDREKRRLEEQGLKRVTSFLPKNLAHEIRGLWEEFDERKTRESKLVRDLDKLEMCMQALEYAKHAKEKERAKFGEFFEDGEISIKTQEIKRIFRKIRAEFMHLSEKKRDVI